MFCAYQFNCKQSETFIFRECLIEAAEIICLDNGPVIKKTYPEV
jgi:hypothetical protein